jgi:hypothetical protein
MCWRIGSYEAGALVLIEAQSARNIRSAGAGKSAVALMQCGWFVHPLGRYLRFITVYV